MLHREYWHAEYRHYLAGSNRVAVDRPKCQAFSATGAQDAYHIETFAQLTGFRRRRIAPRCRLRQRSIMMLAGGWPTSACAIRCQNKGDHATMVCISGCLVKTNRSRGEGVARRSARRGDEYRKGRRSLLKSHHFVMKR